MTTLAPAALADVTASESSLRRFLHGLPGVDAVGVEARVATLASRSIKAATKRQALDLAITCVDLTTLEGADTPGKVTALCAKARLPDPGGTWLAPLTTPAAGTAPAPGGTPCAAAGPDSAAPPASGMAPAAPPAPPVAAVCVYPDLVPVAVAALQGSPVKVASVATAFPSGRASRSVKVADVADAVAAGADEVDMVIDRGAFLSGRYQAVLDDILAVKAASGRAHLKVILETGELATYDNVRRASWLAMLAGADFIKSSTGKIAPAATLPVALVMLRAVRDFHQATGRAVGVKVAGGIRTAKDALRYLVVVHETAGDAWLTPDRFRIGASSLLNDLLMQRATQYSGAYAGPDYFTAA